MKTPSSQNTSQNRARPSVAARGTMTSATRRTHSSRRSRELGRHLVRGQQRRDDPRQRRTLQRAQNPQGLQLVGLGQAVARLRLDRRRAVGQHRGQASGDRRLQLRVGSRTRGAHRGVDPSALRRDLRVGDTRQPLADLGAAVAQPHGMGVRVHEAGDDRAAGGVQGLLGGPAGIGPRVVRLGADEDQLPVLGPNRGVARAERSRPAPAPAAPTRRVAWRDNRCRGSQGRTCALLA